MSSSTNALISGWNAASISCDDRSPKYVTLVPPYINSDYVSMVLNNEDGVKASLSSLASASISARVRMYVRVYVLLEQL